MIINVVAYKAKEFRRNRVAGLRRNAVEQGFVLTTPLTKAEKKDATNYFSQFLKVADWNYGDDISRGAGLNKADDILLDDFVEEMNNKYQVMYSTDVPVCKVNFVHEAGDQPHQSWTLTDETLQWRGKKEQTAEKFGSEVFQLLQEHLGVFSDPVESQTIQARTTNEVLAKVGARQRDPVDTRSTKEKLNGSATPGELSNERPASVETADSVEGKTKAETIH